MLFITFESLYVLHSLQVIMMCMYVCKGKGTSLACEGGGGLITPGYAPAGAMVTRLGHRAFYPRLRVPGPARRGVSLVGRCQWCPKGTRGPALGLCCQKH